jgi:hypothetical protein
MKTSNIENQLRSLISYSNEASPLNDLEQMFFAYLENDMANDKEQRESVVLTYQFIKNMLAEIEQKQQE